MSSESKCFDFVTSAVRNWSVTIEGTVTPEQRARWDELLAPFKDPPASEEGTPR